MNQNILITSSGDIVVTDEHGIPREVENSNNLEKILIKENIIETIENRIIELEEELSECPTSEEINQKRFIPWFSILSIIVSLMWPIINCILKGNVTIFTSTYNIFLEIYKEILSSTLASTLATSILGVCLDTAAFLANKKFKENYNANVAELETLKRILQKEKVELKKLNSSKEIVQQKKQVKYGYNTTTNKINDQKYLNELNDYLEFYRIVGIDLPKLYELYLNNTLDTFFQENGYDFSEEEYETLINYIKEKGQNIVPTKKIRINKK